MKPERYFFVLSLFLMVLMAGNVLAQPQAPVLTVTNGSWVCLSWTEVEGAAGYYLSFMPMHPAGPESIITLDMGTRKSISGELPAGSAYYAAVRSHDGTAYSSFSNIVSIIIGSYPIASDVFTTLERTVSPIALPSTTIQINPADLTLYEIFGYSAWREGPGLDLVKRTDIMPAGYAGASAVNAAGLLHFFTMTDIHLTDKESPAQGIFFGWITPFGAGIFAEPAYSPVIPYSTQVLDAAVQTVNALNNQNAFDFGIFLGDAINNTQYNELRWYIDILDGKEITPSSGDHIGAGCIDYQKPYRAAGLNKSIPWYQVLGNHDQFFLGSFLENDYIRSKHVGDTILNTGNPLIPPGIDNHGYYMGVVDGSTPDGMIRGAGPEADFSNSPKVASDPDRRSLSTTQIVNNTVTGSSSVNWMKEFFQTDSKPAGHGLKQSNIDNDFACYTFEPKTDVPIRVLVLDDTCKGNVNVQTPPYYAQGCIDQLRYDWLVNELDRGQTDGKLMIIAAHVPVAPQKSLTDTTPTNEFYDPSTPDPHSIKNDGALLSTLHNYPNLILWIAGHRHLNTITPQPSSDPSHPENGFWEVETASLRDFPQQLRTFNIVRNTDNTISIIAVNVDPAVQDGSIARRSRDGAIGLYRILSGTSSFGDTTSHASNAELVKQLSPEMQAIIGNYGK